MKKLLSIILSISLLLSMGTVSFAEENLVGSGGSGYAGDDSLTLEEIKESYVIARNLPHRDRDAISLMRSYVNVTVNAVCDQEWIDVMSEEGLGGLDDAEFIIDEISERTENWVGVHLYGYAVRGTTLNESGAGGQKYVDEAWDEYGKGTRDLMIAFYGVRPQESGFGGWAYFGLPKSALFLQTYNRTWQVGIHETGHMYNVKVVGNIDSDCYEECVMNDDMYTNNRYDLICDDCLDLWIDHKNDYPQN